MAGIPPRCSILTPVSTTALTIVCNLAQSEVVTSQVMLTTPNDQNVSTTNALAAGATFQVTFNSVSPVTGVSKVVMIDPGAGYAVNDVLTFKMSQFGNATSIGEFKALYPRRALRIKSGGSSVGRYESTNRVYTSDEITHTTANGSGAELKVFFGAESGGSVVVEVELVSGGFHYAVGDTLTITADKLGVTPVDQSAVDLVVHIDKVTPVPSAPYPTPIKIDQTTPAPTPKSLALSYFRNVVENLTVAAADTAADSAKQNELYVGVTPSHPNVVVRVDGTKVVNAAETLGPLVFNVHVTEGTTKAVITNCGYGGTN